MAKMLGKHMVMEQFLAEGVKHIFGNPGSTELGFMDALQDYPQIQYILSLQEATAVAMADGYARASGRPSVANVHIAPGLANAMSMLYNAYKGGTPLILTAGQQDTRFVLQEPLLWGNLVDMAKQFTKWSVEVNHAADLPMVLRRAFKVAAEPPRGPVFISMPHNVLDQEVEAKIIPATYTSWRTHPDPEAVEEAARLLAEAQNPVILCGDGVAVSGAQRELAALAELVGARVYSAARSETNFPSNHPLYLGGLGILMAAPGALREADVIFAVGVSNPFVALWYSPEPPISEDTKFIHMDMDSWAIGKSFPIALGIIADPKMGLTDLAEAVKGRMSPAARQAVSARASAIEREKRNMREAAERETQRVWDQVPIAPLRLMMELRELLPPGAVIVGGGGTSGGPALQQAVDFIEPGTFFGARGGSLGFGLPGTLGVKLALPERPVIGVVAEGDGMYTNQALWTAVHHNIPVTYIIVNNQSYRILKMNMVRYLGETGRKSQFIGMDLVDPPLDYAKMAGVWGIHGVRVERPQDIKSALREALSIGKEKPALVDVVVDGSYGDYF